MAPESKGSLKTVLLAEDQPQLLKLMQRILERGGFAVLTASTLEDALRTEAEFSGQIHLLITAFYPRDSTGRSMGEILESRQPGLPVMLMSSDPDAETVASWYGWHFLTKPFVPAAFLSAVQAAIHLGSGR